MNGFDIWTTETFDFLQAKAAEISPEEHPHTLKEFEKLFEPYIVQELNKCYAMVMTSTPMIFRSWWNSAGIVGFEPVRISDFNAHFDRVMVTVLLSRGIDPKEVEIDIAAIWKKSKNRRKFAQMIFAPGEELHPRFYNTFQGFAIRHDPSRDLAKATKRCELLLYHIKNRWCGGDQYLYNWVMCWFASILQKPSFKDKWGSCIILRGEPGCGKGLVLQIMAKIIGEKYFTHPSRQDDIFGRFNSCLWEKLLLFGDEIT